MIFFDRVLLRFNLESQSNGCANEEGYVFDIRDRRLLSLKVMTLNNVFI